MSRSDTSVFLRRVLRADAVTCAGAGLLMLSSAGWLQDLLALPPALLRCAGLMLVAFTVLLAWIASRETIPRAGVWLVIASNAIWAADSVLLLLSGWVEPTQLGRAFVIAQALAAALFAELEYFALRRGYAATA